MAESGGRTTLGCRGVWAGTFLRSPWLWWELAHQCYDFSWQAASVSYCLPGFETGSLSRLFSEGCHTLRPSLTGLHLGDSEGGEKDLERCSSRAARWKCTGGWEWSEGGVFGFGAELQSSHKGWKCSHSLFKKQFRYLWGKRRKEVFWGFFAVNEINDLLNSLGALKKTSLSHFQPTGPL